MEIPARMAALPIDPQRGLPVPWFVAWIDDKPDFRVVRKNGFVLAVNYNKCWICGNELGRNVSFVLGPMCAVTRTSAEPPSHRECAIYAAVTCPFLTKPNMRRREKGLPEDRVPQAGNPIARNPGVALVWTTRKWHVFRAPGGAAGVLVEVGDPTETLWYCEGRPATRDEVQGSIESGLPLLGASEAGPEAEAELVDRLAVAWKFLPVS